MSTDWDPKQYLRFAGPRLQPAHDLLARVRAASPRRVVDLGCGPGNVTRLLLDRWPEARIEGVDHSEQMLREASSIDGIVWTRADISSWSSDEPVDVMYSNAALHWLPDHDKLLPRLLSMLAPEGELAVQMPLSWHAPSHVILREVLDTGGQGGQPLGPLALRQKLSRPNVESAERYREMLSATAGEVETWRTDYRHELEGEDAVLEWVRGTALRPVLDVLDESERKRLIGVYRERLREAYPRRDDGVTVYLFPRVFIVVRRH